MSVINQESMRPFTRNHCVVCQTVIIIPSVVPSANRPQSSAFDLPFLVSVRATAKGEASNPAEHRYKISQETSLRRRNVGDNQVAAGDVDVKLDGRGDSAFIALLSDFQGVTRVVPFPIKPSARLIKSSASRFPRISMKGMCDHLGSSRISL